MPLPVLLQQHQQQQQSSHRNQDNHQEEENHDLPVTERSHLLVTTKGQTKSRSSTRKSRSKPSGTTTTATTSLVAQLAFHIRILQGLSIVLLVTLVGVGILGLSWPFNNSATLILSVPLWENEVATENSSPAPLCDQLIMGVWIATCFVVPPSKGKDDQQQSEDGGLRQDHLPQGIVTYPVLILPGAAVASRDESDMSHDDDSENDSDLVSFHLYGYSHENAFWDRREYWEFAQGQASKVSRPNPTQHCVANVTTQQWWRQYRHGTWTTDQTNAHDYYWNVQASTADHGVAAIWIKKDQDTCQLVRQWGKTCRHMSRDVAKAFSAINISLFHSHGWSNDLCY